MTTSVTIHQSGKPDLAVGITEAALKQARYKFNPSSLARVDRIKLLIAALYSEMDAVSSEAVGTEGAAVIGGEAAVAKTQIQGAAMWAVSAATAHL